MKVRVLVRKALQTVGIAAVSLGSAANAAPAGLDRLDDSDGAEQTEVDRRGDALPDAPSRKQPEAALTEHEPFSQTVLRAERAGVTPGAILAAALWDASGLERTYLICDWATSAVLEERLAVAQALSYPLEAVGVWTAIEELRTDRSPAVRLAAERAALLRKLQGTGGA